MADDWTRALRHLTRKVPTEPASAVLDAMRGSDSDRGAATTMASLTDLAMNGILIYGLGIKEQSAIKALFIGDKAPLSTFEAKCEVASSIGLIGENTINNLEVIRHIRNTFAHAIANISFEEPEMERACNRLRLSDTHESLIKSLTSQINRQRYGYACHAIYLGSVEIGALSILSGQTNEPIRKILP
jgi:hypothetical protein